MSILYLVATPIGNLEDISARALRILRQVKWIAAEDTRQTRKLLQHYDIQTSLISFHEHSKQSKYRELMDRLEEGDLALVSDAGTPILNDPGYELVHKALKAGHEVSPIPGASAPIAALVASGLPADSFLYLGYLPRKSPQRRSMLNDVASMPYTLVLLETPHRLLEALKDMRAELGDRELAVARELTKLHEEIYRGRISDAIEHYTKTPPRGEITLIVSGKKAAREMWPEDKLYAVLRDRLAQDLPPTELASQIAAESGWPRREVYRRIIEVD